MCIRDRFEEGTPHANSFKWSSLGPLNLGLGRYQEISCFHYSTKTLHVTDAIVGIDSIPPEIFNFDPTPLLFHSRERGDEPLIDSIEQRKKGWKRLVLFSSFLNAYLNIFFIDGIFNLPGFKKDENRTNLFHPFFLCSMESIKGSSPLSLE